MCIRDRICVINIQPRRRPRIGSAYRSSKGDHRNFQVNGSCINANRPIEVRSTFSERSHAGRRLISSQSGRPELKPVKMQISIRRLNNASEIFLGPVIARIVTVSSEPGGAVSSEPGPVREANGVRAPANQRQSAPQDVTSYE